MDILSIKLVNVAKTFVCYLHVYDVAIEWYSCNLAHNAVQRTDHICQTNLIIRVNILDQGQFCNSKNCYIFVHASKYNSYKL